MAKNMGRGVDFQLPLSGSPPESARLGKRHYLSTPSLGITTSFKSAAEFPLPTFNSLSRDHLRSLREMLSRQMPAFISLSRDHITERTGACFRGNAALSTPSLGITSQLLLERTWCPYWPYSFQLPLSGSQEDSVAQTTIVVTTLFQLPLSGSQDSKEQTMYRC